MQTIEVFENKNLVGNLMLLDRNSYAFTYSPLWLKSESNFSIDPLLPLSSETYYSKDLWGAFSDISPDRWGKLLQERMAGRLLNHSEYMLGVSDYYRIGALRLKVNNEFIAPHSNVLKLAHLSQIQDSTLRVENDEYTKDDLKLLLDPSSSIGGARPKSSIEDNNILYIAKFPSLKDTYSVTLWEAVMLELCKRANIESAEYKIISAGGKNVLLVKRFDRDFKTNGRIPFMSARTLLGITSKEDAERQSYVNIARKLDSNNKQKLFKRMLFNALFSNTDDHLRNHALLYDKQTKSWNLSPAYDVNPKPYKYEKQIHALNFVDSINTPSLKLCQEIACEFDVNNDRFLQDLQDCIRAGEQYREIALKFGIKSNEIDDVFAESFTHSDIALAKEMLGNKANKNTQSQHKTIKPKSRGR